MQESDDEEAEDFTAQLDKVSGDEDDDAPKAGEKRKVRRSFSATLVFDRTCRLTTGGTARERRQRQGQEEGQGLQRPGRGLVILETVFILLPLAPCSCSRSRRCLSLLNLQIELNDVLVPY